MNKGSTAQKLGVVAKVATQQARRNRTVRAMTGALSTTGRAFGRVGHKLWLEVTGLVFLMMAAGGGAEVVREFTKYEAGKTSVGRLAVVICFTVTFAWFGASSFWRVKRKGKGAR